VNLRYSKCGYWDCGYWDTNPCELHGTSASSKTGWGHCGRWAVVYEVKHQVCMKFNTRSGWLGRTPVAAHPAPYHGQVVRTPAVGRQRHMEDCPHPTPPRTRAGLGGPGRRWDGRGPHEADQGRAGGCGTTTDHRPPLSLSSGSARFSTHSAAPDPPRSFNPTMPPRQRLATQILPSCTRTARPNRRTAVPQDVYLRYHKLRVSGTKAELVARIRRHMGLD
jgi:hypothetical protein